MSVIQKRNYRVIDYTIIPLKIAPLPVMLMLILKVFIALFPSLQVIATSAFIDKAIDVFNNGNISEIYIKLFNIVFLICIYWMSLIALSFINLKLDIKMDQCISIDIIKKRTRLNYKYLEDNDTCDLISKVGENTSEQILKGFNNLLNIIEYCIKIFSLLFIIATHVWWVAVVVFLIATPLLFIAVKNGKVDYEAFSNAQKYRRKADYLKDVLSSRENIEERSLFGYAEAIDKIWFNRYETARKIEYKATKKNFIKTKIASIITAFLSMIIALVLIIPTSTGKITVGMYMSLITASFNLVKQMSWELSVVMQEFTKNKLYLKDFQFFANLDEVTGADTCLDMSIQSKPLESIEFKNVHFSYPGSDVKILNGLSMKLEKDKQYAFVGKNGAGKTTITKLLTGLYTDYEGEILINGQDIKTISNEQLKAYFSVVYQDFAKYYLSIKDNLLLGNSISNLDSNYEKTMVEKALDIVDMSCKISDFPKGIYTLLGNLTDECVDLSGGQWQRISIARSLVSEAPICILDEPTASLDPISESKLYKIFGKASKGKLTILITHRLGAARVADEILVLDNGKVIEQGNHKDLVEQNSVYKKMFDAQRGWYNE